MPNSTPYKNDRSMTIAVREGMPQIVILRHLGSGYLCLPVATRNGAEQLPGVGVLWMLK